MEGSGEWRRREGVERVERGRRRGYAAMPVSNPPAHLKAEVRVAANTHAKG